jgi:hypothetical protein
MQDVRRRRGEKREHAPSACYCRSAVKESPEPSRSLAPPKRAQDRISDPLDARDGELNERLCDLQHDRSGERPNEHAGAHVARIVRSDQEPADSDQDREEEKKCTHHRIDEQDREGGRERGARVIGRKRRIVRPDPRMRDPMRQERPLPKPQRDDDPVDRERHPRSKQPTGCGHLLLAARPRPREQPKTHRYDDHERNARLLEPVEERAQPVVVEREIVDRPVEAPGHALVVAEVMVFCDAARYGSSAY